MAAAPVLSSQYTVLRLPKSSPRLTELVSKFQDAKLAALKADPGSFVQRYDLEKLQPVSVWQARLDRQITILACVYIDDNTLPTEDALLRGEWVGFAAIRGPMTVDDYYPSPDMGQPKTDCPGLETRWHMFDLYTSPRHRNHGIAKKLWEGMLAVATADALAEHGAALEKMRLRLFVNPKTAWLVDLYRRLGFQDSGMVTLKEGFVANGMEESVPEDTKSTAELRAIWETRYGLAMEKIVNIVPTKK